MEIWKDIEGYDGLYQVSNLGKVKSLKFGKEKILKFKIHKDGYFLVSLSKKNELNQYLAHRLVSQAFIPNPENKPQINHINGIRNDNRVENLEWCTASENHLHSYKFLGHTKINLGKTGALHPRSKKVNQYDLQGNFIKTWDSIKDVERNTGIYQTSISKCCKGKRNKTGGYKWEYKKE